MELFLGLTFLHPDTIVKDFLFLFICISETEITAIENCVFQHKAILIGKKTLKDTVLPKQHWTLKQASRGGCSCCDPDPFDEEMMEQNQAENGLTSSRLSVAGVDVTSPFTSTAVESIQIFATATIRDPATSKASSRGYVDGKRSFAFDPTKFAQFSAS